MERINQPPETGLFPLASEEMDSGVLPGAQRMEVVIQARGVSARDLPCARPPAAEPVSAARCGGRRETTTGGF